MAQRCRVCAHPQTKEIEQEIVNGTPHTTIADQYGIHFQSVRYHSENHLPDKLVRATQKKGQEHAEDILSGIKDLLDRTRTILQDAEEEGHNRLALDAIKEARSTYELLSKIAVKLEEYRRKNQERETGYVDQSISEGLQMLTDEELEALVMITGKVHEANPDYELDPTSRYAVEGMRMLQKERNSDADTNTYDDADSRGNDGKQDNNSQKTGGYEDELDLDNLELNDWDGEEIPSDETDPKWLREERRHY